jgi:peptidoglycan/xylan/chitin deacetylase (PgdA/CDA1 family)
VIEARPGIRGLDGEDVVLRMDDVGAASKRWEVHGRTRVSVAGRRLPFPGNLLFLKYLPPIKQWGPYRELDAAQWERILDALARAGARLSVPVTAGWVERDGRVTPFPARFPAQARVLRRGLEARLVEILNHGWTHCVLEGGRFRPRLFHGNREFHREFVDGLPPEVHRDHLRRAQEILQDCFGVAIAGLVPPGNAFTRDTLAAAVALGIRYVSAKRVARWGEVPGLVLVDNARVWHFHDRDVVRGGVGWLARMLEGFRGRRFLTLREAAARSAAPAGTPPTRDRAGS